MATRNLEVSRMAHLKQKTVSDNSCKAIVIDTILEAISPLTKDDLANEISSIFHVLISKERLDEIIDELSNANILQFDIYGHIDIAPVKKADFMTSRSNEVELQKKASLLWLDDIAAHHELSDSLKDKLQQALPIFLRSLFVRHGVSSYEILVSFNECPSFDVKQIANNVSQQFDDIYQNDIARILPKIFQSTSHPDVMEYLKHGINKAVGYICEVISDENLKQITTALENLTIYLDTNAIYRLLNLQGQVRYEAIKETLEFCKDNGVKLKVSAITKREFTSRLEFDSKVLRKFPTKVNLIQYGYKYRTTDNYVSTYWKQALSTRISVDDFVDYYNNFDILFEEEHIEIESIEVDEIHIIDSAKELFEKMSLRDPDCEKNDSALWHDAYCFAYVQKMQKVDAKTAIDTECLFLTTDRALTNLQRDDYDLKGRPPVVISPSQLLQIFSFSKPGCDYEETFVKFFASSSLGLSFSYSNDDIQEILSRISHYEGVNPDIAEKILARQITASRSWHSATDVEKEEIVYEAISEELIRDLTISHAQVAELEAENEALAERAAETIKKFTTNQKHYSEELQRIQNSTNDAIEQQKAETNLREKAEEENRKTTAYSNAQQKLYIDEKWALWKLRHLLIFWGTILTAVVIIGITVYLWYNSGDTGYWGLLALLSIPALFFPFGCKVFSAGVQSEIREKLLEDYREKLNSDHTPTPRA